VDPLEDLLRGYSALRTLGHSGGVGSWKSEETATARWQDGKDGQTSLAPFRTASDLETVQCARSPASRSLCTLCTLCILRTLRPSWSAGQPGQPRAGGWLRNVPPTSNLRLPSPDPRRDVAWGEALPLSTRSELAEVDGETGDHQDDGIGSASYGLIDAPENIAVVPPQ
jgi:hypothetical protein